MQASLATTPLGVQQTLSAYLFAFGVMFLFHGALSDSFGRRPVILVSLVVFTIASVVAALADLACTGSIALARASRACRSAPAWWWGAR